MCTLGGSKINGYFYLFKNRDLLSNVKTRVIQESEAVRKFVITDHRNHCEGLNRHGIGFVEASLEPYGRKHCRTFSSVGRKILNQSDVRDAISVISRHRISGNIILSDGRSAFIIERTPDNMAVTEIGQHGVITNHSIKLDKRNHPSVERYRILSEKRYKRASKLVGGIRNVADVERFLSDTRNGPEFSIHNELTRCSFIYDLKGREVLFYDKLPTQGNGTRFSLG